MSLRKKSRIAPLQPPTLAPFPAWGGSKGAGRTGLAAKLVNLLKPQCNKFYICGKPLKFMETAPVFSRSKAALKYGALLGATSYLFSFLSQITQLGSVPGGGFLSFILIVLLVGLPMAIGVKKHREANGGFISFGQSYGTAFLIGLFGTIIITVLTFVVLQFAGESYKEQLDKQKYIVLAEQEQQGADDNAIKMTEQIFDYIATPTGASIIVVVSYIFWSAIVALVVSLIFRKEDPSSFGFPNS